MSEQDGNMGSEHLSVYERLNPTIRYFTDLNDFVDRFIKGEERFMSSRNILETKSLNEKSMFYFELKDGTKVPIVVYLDSNREVRWEFAYIYENPLADSELPRGVMAMSPDGKIFMYDNADLNRADKVLSDFDGSPCFSKSIDGASPVTMKMDRYFEGVRSVDLTEYVSVEAGIQETRTSVVDLDADKTGLMNPGYWNRPDIKPNGPDVTGILPADYYSEDHPSNKRRR